MSSNINAFALNAPRKLRFFYKTQQYRWCFPRLQFAGMESAMCRFIANETRNRYFIFRRDEINENLATRSGTPVFTTFISKITSAGTISATLVALSLDSLPRDGCFRFAFNPVHFYSWIALKPPSTGASRLGKTIKRSSNNKFDGTHQPRWQKFRVRKIHRIDLLPEPLPRLPFTLCVYDFAVMSRRNPVPVVPRVSLAQIALHLTVSTCLSASLSFYYPQSWLFSSWREHRQFNPTRYIQPEQPSTGS